ncbi:MAG: hypothetical protein ABI639_04245 [Thermoanaerobaculia bacterium]
MPISVKSGRPGKWLSRLALATALALVGAPAALCAEAELFPAGWVRLGGGVLTNDTKVGLASGAGDRAVVDLGRDFGLGERETVGFVALGWLPAKHHEFRFSYFQAGFSGGDAIGRTFHWNGQTYPVGASTEADLDVKVYELDWTWWILRQEKAGLGLEIGATVLDLALDASARFQLGDIIEVRRETASTTAPVPTVGIAGRAEVVPGLFLDASARWLSGVRIDEVEGDALQIQAALEWMITRNFGVGAGYQRFAFDGDLSQTGFRGTLDFTLDGLQAYAKFAW